MQHDNTEAIPDKIKKNVAFETIKGICTSLGITIIGVVAATLLARRVNAEAIKNKDPLQYETFKKVSRAEFRQIVGNSALVSMLLTPIHVVAGYLNYRGATEYNKQIDSFTQRIEAEKAERAITGSSSTSSL